MARLSRSAAGVAVAATLALVGGCAGGGTDQAGNTTTTSSPASTTASTDPMSSSSTSLKSTTSTPSTTSTTSPRSTTTAGGRLVDIPGYTSALVRAWGRGDHQAALRYAVPAVVSELFSHADPGGPMWDLDLARCEGAVGTQYCVFQDPSDPQELTLGIVVAALPDPGGVLPRQAVSKARFTPKA